MCEIPGETGTTSHLGLFSLLLCEYEECITGQEVGNGYIQEGDVLPEDTD